MFPLYFLYDMWPVLILRIALGIVFLAHGWPKLRDVKQAGKNFDGLGFKPGIVFAVIASLLEFFGAIGLILGIFTTYIAGLFMIEFIIILIWKWFTRTPLRGQNGWELDVLIFAMCVALFALGGGAYSLDRILFGWL